jgi:predicted ATP-dependent endonuclease of OLD family
MKLKKLNVDNYRSIANLEINAKDNCLIFIGINESGKSNILNAIKYLDPGEKYNFKIDRKIPSDENGSDENTKFKFSFSLSPEEKEDIISLHMGNALINPISVRGVKKNFFNNLIKDQTIIIEYEKNERKENLLHNIKEDFEIKKGYLRLKKECGGTEKKVIFKGGDEFKLSDLWYINTEKCSNLSEVEEYFEEFSKENLIDDIAEDIKNYIFDNRPEVIYWNFDKSMLITEPINITEFSNNPSICVPLKNIFKLAGIKDIKLKIEETKDDLNQFKNLQKRLSNASTEHIYSIWKEYKDVKINIDDNTQFFIASIQDTKNLYNIGQRSDGFKRFVSFLLTISAEHRSKNTKNQIIILDEPDISLHPSGIKYLLEEILKISKKNNVFIATHSIFMIDRNKIDRHRIVKKENECTKIIISNKENFMQEEVLFNSLGYSLFEIIKHNNLMVEGYIDKEIIKVLNEKLGNRINFNNCALCWGDGVDNIPNIVAVMIGTKRNFIITVDKDSAGNKVIEKLNRSYQDQQDRILNFGDIVESSKSTYTIEDFIPVAWIIELLGDHLNLIINNPSEIFDNSKIDENNGILESWNVFVNRYYPSHSDKLKEGFKNRIPSLIIRKIEEGNINLEEEFEDFMKFTEKVNSFIE